MSSQTKINFPQKEKSAVFQKMLTKAKSSILSTDNLNKNGTLANNVHIPIKIKNKELKNLDLNDIVDCTLPRSTRSSSKLNEIPKTPKSQRKSKKQCETPKSQPISAAKTPSTLFKELTINSPKTPSSLLTKLKIDSPKRKIDRPLEFSSPKRLYNDIVSVDSIDKILCLLSDDEDELYNSPSKNIRSNNSGKSRTKLSSKNIVDFKKPENVTKKTKEVHCSPLHVLQNNEPYKSPLKSSNSPKEESKRSSRLNSNRLEIVELSPEISLRLISPLKNGSTELRKMNSHDSPKRSLRFNSPHNNTASPSKKSKDVPLNQTETITESPKRSLRLLNSPLKRTDLEKSSPLKNVHQSPMKLNNSFEIRSVKLDSIFSKKPNQNENVFGLKTGGNDLRSPFKTEIFRPLSPIKNIILDKKSPFKQFIRDEASTVLQPKTIAKVPSRNLFGDDKQEKVAAGSLKKKESSPLPGREIQIIEIRNFLLNHLNNESSGSMYISGPPGTGKSASLKIIIEEPEIRNEYKTIYINCNSVKNAASVYEKIVSELKLSTQGKSERHQLAAIQKHLESKHKMILLILDEIDALETRKQTILYTIFEWPSIKQSKLVLVGVANALDLTDRILPRLQANITLNPTLMNFAPYSKQQILEIITKKLKETDKFNMFDAVALQLLAGKVAAVSGDIRKAIDITNHLIDLTYDNVKENGEVSIGLKEVLAVISSVYSTSQSLNCSKDQDSFPLQQKLALASFLLLKTKPHIREVTLGKLHEVYTKVCSQRNLQPLDMSEFISACSLLDARGVLRIYGKTKNRISKVTLQWDEQDVKEAMRDKHLISTILNDTACLER